eukprot:44819_1
MSMRCNAFLSNYFRKHHVFVNTISRSHPQLLCLHKHLFCVSSETSSVIKEVSLDDLLSSALRDTTPASESDCNITNTRVHEAITTQPIIESTDEQMEHLEDDDSDDDLDAIIDEIESMTSETDALTDTNASDAIDKYNQYLPAIPQNMVHQTFRSMNLRKKLERNLCSVHGLSPLPIQSLSFDKITHFKNTYPISGSIIESAMGSGKTLAYLLPILNELKPLQTGQIIIVIPSNELGIQIKAMVKSYLINTEDYKHNHQSSSYLANNQQNKNRRNKQFHLQHSVMNCNSNESLDYHIDYIKKVSPSIIVGTPKRIRELLLYGILKPSKINYVVFDEVDTLFPVKAKNVHKNKLAAKQHLSHSHLKPSQLILNGIVKQQSNVDASDGHKCHALFVGATIPNQLKSYINQILQPYPVQLISAEQPTHRIKSRKSSKLLSPNIKHQYISVDGDKDKPFIIADLIHTIRSDPKKKKLYNPAVLIFVSKDTSPIKFAERLCQHDMKCALLHEYINDKTMRSKFLKLFKNGSIDAVIATESICRGLDFIWLDHIIVGEMPHLDTNYLHIAGRCSRLESKGFVTSIVDEFEEDRLKTYCFKYQIELTPLDDKTKINELSKQKRKYNKLNTFPLLLQNKQYQKKLQDLQSKERDKFLTDDKCL